MVLTHASLLKIGKLEVFTSIDGPDQKMVRTVDIGSIFGKKDNTTNER